MASCKIVLFDQTIIKLKLKEREVGLSLSLQQVQTYEPETKSLIYFVGEEMNGFEEENELFINP